MADDTTHYRARAAREAATADAAVLDNVRDRARRAANAWTELAVRAERATTQRLRREAESATRIAAAAAADQHDGAVLPPPPPLS